MRISKGVEWAAHACTLLVPLWPDKGLPLSALAEFHGLPEPYMAKQMQALSHAGITCGGRGRGGFYMLARAPDQITLLDILLAVDGEESMFRCAEIRQNGPCSAEPEDCRAPCNIAAGFARAEAAYRRSLAEMDLAMLTNSIAAQLSSANSDKTIEWMRNNLRPRG